MIKPTPLEASVRHLRPVVKYAAWMSLFINLLILPMSLYSLQIFDRVVATGSYATLIWLTVIMLVIFAAVGLLQSLRGTVLTRAADWLYTTLCTAAIPLSITQASASGNGKGMQSLRDAGVLKQFIGGTGLSTLLEVPWAALYIIMLFVVHVSLGVVVTLGAVLLMVLALMNEAAINRAVKQASAGQIRSMQDLETAARNADVVEAMGLTDTIVRLWQQSQKAMQDEQKESLKRSNTIQGVTRFIKLSLQIIVTAVAALLTLQGHITIGAIIASSILASRALAPFGNAIAGWKSFTEARAAYERLQDVFKNPLRQEGIQLPTPQGRLTVESLSYGVPTQQKPILMNVSFGLMPGESLGIIGPSGSGKSSLARLLTGAWKPTAGNVRLDGADVYSWPRTEFGRYTGYLPQDVELFGGTIKANIARLDLDAPDDRVVFAAQLAGAHELILRMPQGYMTDIGTHGEKLSAGQRQRIGLARALYGKPRLVILDEPDSNLDDVGQTALIHALHELKARHISVVIITHRRSILSHVDKILCLNEGAVQAFGIARDVMTKLSTQATARRMEVA